MSLIKSILHRKDTFLASTEQVEDMIESQEEIDNDNASEKGEFWHMEQVKGVILEEKDVEYELVEREILPEKIICPDCGGITLEGLDFCDKCGGEISSN